MHVTQATQATQGSDRGSGTVWIVTLCMLIWFVTGTILLTASLRVERHRAAAAADLAALAAAQAVTSQTACATAGEVAAANDAELTECQVSGPTVTVTVTVQPHLLPHEHLSARARAGPTGSGPTNAPDEP